ncbi:uncharacterized protein LOC131889364 [Tigriopus californicus]|uniref:uncharacterized protein LOC131889364 n=1 Tax=Tigriopus californicus TaxID=6832 RepID=UPI0027DA1A6B|nr:uncharacterized protein LOC131889364 [Tigriopus californicus]
MENNRQDHEVLADEVYAQAVTAATKQISAITAELEIVRDSWYEVIKSEHPVAQEPQLKALLALKLQEVGESIPHRRAAEKRFKEENGFLTRTLDNLDTIMGILESKEMEDPSARIEFFQAQEMANLIRQILVILESGGFYGHKVSCNDPTVLNNVADERVDRSGAISLLGLHLEYAADQFNFDLDDKFLQFDRNATVITRRDIVSLASQVFDTQGYVSPFMMNFKSILPMLWYNKTKWDENLLTKRVKDEEGREMSDPVAQQAVELFKKWIDQIPLLKEFSFPRWTRGPIVLLTIFSDASTAGMGVAAYLICGKATESLNSQLIFSKSSLMPKNLRSGAEAKDALTIARAELIGLLMAVNLGHYLQNAFNREINQKQIVYFTDSLLNLQRTQRGKGHCKVWEERRIEKILEKTQTSEIRFCPGKLNPADLPSRGCSLMELKDKFDFWSKGPDFLTKPRKEWPVQPVVASTIIKPQGGSDNTDPDQFPYLANCSQEVDLYFTQMRRIKGQSKGNVEKRAAARKLAFLDTLVENCESWLKIVKVLVRIRLLFQRIGKRSGSKQTPNSNVKYLSNEDVSWAETILVRHEQERTLSKEIEFLKQQNEDQPNWLPKGSILRNLPVFWDAKQEVIKMETRLHLSSSLTHEFANPMILPKGLVAERKILHLHHSRMHISQRQTFNILRQKNWVVGGFGYVKSIVRKCKTPRCRYIKFNSPKMSPLPALRLDNPKPWVNVGVDYTGPLTCKHDCYPELNAKVKTDIAFKHLTHEQQICRSTLKP